MFKITIKEPNHKVTKHIVIILNVMDKETNLSNSKFTSKLASI